MENVKLKRTEEIILNRLRIVNPKLTNRFVLAKKEPPICEACGTMLIVKRLLTDIKDIKKTEYILSWSIASTIHLDPTQNKTKIF